jgi:hypothetical protein
MWRKLVLVFGLAGCAANPYDRNNYQNVSNYSIKVNSYTAKGIAVDTSGQQISLLDMDARTDNVEACLSKLYPNGMLPSNVVSKGSCLYHSFNTHIERQYIQVKIADDWFLTPLACSIPGYGQQEVLKGAPADQKLCEAKGLVVTQQCQCYYRDVVQDQSDIVTTPNLHMFDEALIKIVTSCGFTWIPGLQECYSP